MFIIRRDISSFYESISVSRTRDFLELNAHVPARIRNYLRSFFSTFCDAGKGVPRGVGLSTVISELAMRDLDLKIRQIPGVYKYFRYSDDILIFSHSNPLPIEVSLFEAFKKEGFIFNDKKSYVVCVDCKEKTKVRRVHVEYLGYKFSFGNGFGDEKARKVEVSISERKITKIKTRLICSLKRYKLDGDFLLLLDRIKFIASNYFAYRSGAASIKTSKFVKSGIFYNYRLCGEYSGLKREAHFCRELKALDGFYLSLLKGKSSDFSSLFASTVGVRRLKTLEKISFFKGYEKKITVRFRPERVQQIKSAWRNV